MFIFKIPNDISSKMKLNVPIIALNNMAIKLPYINKNILYSHNVKREHGIVINVKTKQSFNVLCL
mgnify:CR=1 FL=1